MRCLAVSERSERIERNLNNKCCANNSSELKTRNKRANKELLRNVVQLRESNSIACAVDMVKLLKPQNTKQRQNRESSPASKMSINTRWWNVKRRRKCNSIPLWIICCCCFFNGLKPAGATYAEADDLINELDRPSEYEINFHRKTSPESTMLYN